MKAHFSELAKQSAHVAELAERATEQAALVASQKRQLALLSPLEEEAAALRQKMEEAQRRALAAETRVREYCSPDAVLGHGSNIEMAESSIAAVNLAQTPTELYEEQTHQLSMTTTHASSNTFVAEVDDQLVDKSSLAPEKFPRLGAGVPESGAFEWSGDEGALNCFHASAMHVGGSGSNPDKQNQDALFCARCDAPTIVWGVLDGHGHDNGALASQVLPSNAPWLSV